MMEFVKMHGLGNDFVVIDAIKTPISLTNQQKQALCDRRRGVGCDQILVMEPSRQDGADLFMAIYNPDGSEAGACGNGTRCVAHLWMSRNGRKDCVIETVAGLLRCRMADNDMVRVDMGVPCLNWDQIPLAQEQDTLSLDLAGVDGTPVAVNMGNPHAVFFVDDISKVDLAGRGPQVENHALFPQRTNVEFVQVLGPETIRMRVWERGAGITQACGSGACATMVAAVRRGLSSRRAEVILDGGSLFMEWREEDGHVLMTGPTATVFEGRYFLT